MWDGDYVSGGTSEVRNMDITKIFTFFLGLVFGVACGFFVNWLAYGHVQHGADLAAAVVAGAFVGILGSAMLNGSIK